MRRACILAVTLVSFIAVGSAAAQTIPVPLSFNNAVLTTPGFKDVVVVSPKTPPITAIAQLDESTGAFTINPSDFHFPPHSFSSPVPGTVQVALNAPAKGQFNPATGFLTVTADYLATINLSGIGSCVADTGQQTYTTSNTTVYPGVPFPATASGPVTGPGAFTGGWPNVSSSGAACPLLSSSLNGPGGLWISKNISPPSVNLVLAASPKKAKASVGKSTVIKVTVRDTGKLAAHGVKVCTTAPKRVHVAGAKCRTIAALGAGARKTIKFTLKGTKAGKSKVKFSASATGAKSAKAAMVLRVTK